MKKKRRKVGFLFCQNAGLKQKRTPWKKSYTIFITDVLSRNENIAWLTWCYRRTRSNGFPIEKSIHCCQSDHCIKSITKNFLYTDSSRKTTRYELHDTRLRNPQIITVFRNSNNINETNSNVLSWYEQVKSIKHLVLNKQFLLLRRAKEVIIGRR